MLSHVLVVKIVVHHHTGFNHSSAESTYPTFFVVISVTVHIKSDAAHFEFLYQVRLSCVQKSWF